MSEENQELDEDIDGILAEFFSNMADAADQDVSRSNQIIEDAYNEARDAIKGLFV
jgi:hypothetical protein